jgi:hypothetical protein
MKTENLVGSNLPETIVEQPKLEGNKEKRIGTENLGPGSFTTFYTWRGNGTVRKLKFDHSSVNANSRVFISISEFNSDAQINRFIGDARMAVYNVAPFNGGFFAWVEVSFGSALNVRFDILVDP